MRNFCKDSIHEQGDKAVKPLTTNRRVLIGLAATTSLATAGLVHAAGANAAPASAATVSFSGQKLVFQAAPGQKNDLKVTKSWVGVPSDAYGAARYTYRLDDRVPLESDSENCAYPDTADRTLLVCTFVHEDGQDPGHMSSFKLGDKDDKVTFFNPTDSYSNDEVHLGAGNDTYTSGDRKKPDATFVSGGAGNDKITTGRQQGDVSGIRGGSGNDVIRTTGSSAAGVWGQAGHDKLYGGPAGQSFDGGTGNDLVRGGGGPDEIVGGKGNDTLYGDAGADTIKGNSGNDKLYGGPGTDTLLGGPGKDSIKQN